MGTNIEDESIEKRRPHLVDSIHPAFRFQPGSHCRLSPGHPCVGLCPRELGRDRKSIPQGLAAIRKPKLVAADRLPGNCRLSV